MDRLRMFSVDENSHPFWPSPSAQSPAPSLTPLPAEGPKMNRSSSEWAFQRFLQEAEIIPSSIYINPLGPPSRIDCENEVVEIKDPHPPPPSDLPPNVPIDSEEYQAILKRRLDLACAAVALSRAMGNGLQILHNWNLKLLGKE